MCLAVIPMTTRTTLNPIPALWRNSHPELAEVSPVVIKAQDERRQATNDNTEFMAVLAVLFTVIASVFFLN